MGDASPIEAGIFRDKLKSFRPSRRFNYGIDGKRRFAAFRVRLPTRRRRAHPRLPLCTMRELPRSPRSPLPRVHHRVRRSLARERARALGDVCFAQTARPSVSAGSQINLAGGFIGQAESILPVPVCRFDVLTRLASLRRRSIARDLIFYASAIMGDEDPTVHGRERQRDASRLARDRCILGRSRRYDSGYRRRHSAAVNCSTRAKTSTWEGADMHPHREIAQGRRFSDSLSPRVPAER